MMIKDVVVADLMEALADMPPTAKVYIDLPDYDTRPLESFGVERHPDRTYNEVFLKIGYGPA